MKGTVVASEFTYTISFARPAYEFVGRWLDLFERIQTRLGTFGTGPEDIRFETPSGGQPHVLRCAPSDSGRCSEIVTADGVRAFRSERVPIGRNGTVGGSAPLVRLGGGQAVDR